MRTGRYAAAAMALMLTAASAFPASVGDLKRLYDPIIEKTARSHGLDPGLIHAVIRAESNYDRFAISEQGAMGLMQLMPATAARYGVKNVFDAAQNVEGGAKYLKDLIKLYGRRTDYALAAYNAGQEAVRRYNGVPPFQETKDYIARIQESYTRRLDHKPIFRFRDASGHWVLTDDPDYKTSGKDVSAQL
jgi:soluble lytic murein transglycosylase-like protein